MFSRENSIFGLCSTVPLFQIDFDFVYFSNLFRLAFLVSFFCQYTFSFSFLRYNSIQISIQLIKKLKEKVSQKFRLYILNWNSGTVEHIGDYNQKPSQKHLSCSTVPMRIQNISEYSFFVQISSKNKLINRYHYSHRNRSVNHIVHRHRHQN